MSCFQVGVWWLSAHRSPPEAECLWHFMRLPLIYCWYMQASRDYTQTAPFLKIDLKFFCSITFKNAFSLATLKSPWLPPQLGVINVWINVRKLRRDFTLILSYLTFIPSLALTCLRSVPEMLVSLTPAENQASFSGSITLWIIHCGWFLHMLGTRSSNKQIMLR